MHAANVEAGDEQVRLDVCRPCRMVWFDGGEMETVVESRAAHTNDSAAGPEPRDTIPSMSTREAVARFQVECLQRMNEEERPTADREWKLIPAILGMPVKIEEHELARRPWFTWSLLASLAIAGALARVNLERAIAIFGFRADAPPFEFIVTAFTSFFVHASVLRLVGNLYWLWVFGEDVEDVFGRSRFVWLLSLSILGSALAHAVWTQHPEIPLVGASGGISGIVVCFALEFPRARIGGGLGPSGASPFAYLTLSARMSLVAWIGFQTLATIFDFAGVSPAAHLGGAAVGFAFWWVMRRGLRPPDRTSARA